MELELWHHLLSHCNGITFFYKQMVSNPHYMQMFKDATPSSGFGCNYNGHLFASPWPPELPFYPSPSQTPSSALNKVYAGATNGQANLSSFTLTTLPLFLGSSKSVQTLRHALHASLGFP